MYIPRQRKAYNPLTIVCAKQPNVAGLSGSLDNVTNRPPWQDLTRYVIILTPPPAGIDWMEILH